MTFDPNARALSKSHKNGSKRQRFATDAAKAKWYAAYRNNRFARRFGNAQGV